MTDLVAFLRARLAEDEAAARSVRDPRWRSAEREGTLTLDAGPESQGWSFGGGSGVWQCDDPEDDCQEYRSMAEAEVDHIARHDPARVLADVEAKRRIVEMHGELNDGYGETGLCDEDHEMIPCETLRLLALPYADHPDYDESWRP